MLPLVRARFPPTAPGDPSSLRCRTTLPVVQEAVAPPGGFSVSFLQRCLACLMSSPYVKEATERGKSQDTWMHLACAD